MSKPIWEYQKQLISELNIKIETFIRLLSN